ncbi:MAG TPA: response regulator [Hanamia sp.]
MPDQKCVLICDDDNSILDVCKLILHDEYRVETVTNCGHIIEHIKSIKPKIVLMDVVMPGEGANAAKLIHSTPETRHIPVVLFSALSNIKEISESADATAILEKPFDLKVLLQTVRKYIL